MNCAWNKHFHLVFFCLRNKTDRSDKGRKIMGSQQFFAFSHTRQEEPKENPYPAFAEEIRTIK